jgi:myosin heavy subunit
MAMPIHLLTMAERARRSLCLSPQQQQVIVLSGQSGSGKASPTLTLSPSPLAPWPYAHGAPWPFPNQPCLHQTYSANAIVAHLARAPEHGPWAALPGPTTSVHAAIVATGPLLEAFGNAR